METSDNTVVLKLDLDASEIKAVTTEVCKIAVEEITKLKTTANDALRTMADDFARVGSALDTLASLDTLTKNLRDMKTSYAGATVVMNTMTASTTLATIAKKALDVAMGAVGAFSLAVVAIGAVAGVLSLFKKKAVEASEDVKQLKEETANYSEEVKKQAEETEDAVRSSIVQYDLAKKYKDELLTLIDVEGKIISSKERVNFLVDELNKLFPGTISFIDGETLAMEDQGKAIDNLILKKKAEALASAYSDDYQKFLKEENTLIEQQIANETELSKLKDMDNDRKTMKANGDNNNINATLHAKYGDDFASLEQLDEDIKVREETAKNIQDKLDAGNKSKYIVETTYEYIAKGDYEGLEQFMKESIDGIDLIKFDSSKGEGQKKDLTDQISALETQYAEYEKLVAANNMQKSESYETAMQNKMEVAKEQLDMYNAESQMVKEDLENQLKHLEESYAKYLEDVEAGTRQKSVAFEEQYDQKSLDFKSKLAGLSEETQTAVTDESATQIKDTLVNAGGEAYENIANNISASEPLPLKVEIKVTNQEEFDNYMKQSVTWNGAFLMGGIVKGGTEQAEQNPLSRSHRVSNELIGKAQEEVFFGQQRMANNVLSAYYARQMNYSPTVQGEKNVVVKEQVVNFNQPIKRPSEVSKEMKKLSQDLARRR